MNGHTKRILVTVKAYPNPSKKYGETVCVAGIDVDAKKWVRLYPIPFRDLDEDKKFKKYAIIGVRAIKAVDDKRPESYRVDAGSIRQIGYLDTVKDKWAERKKIVLPTIDKSFCDVLRSNYAQLSFFDKKKKAVEAIPFEFRYQFFCNDEPSCPGHNLMIIDWEIGQAFRDWRYKYKTEDLLLVKIRQRWLDLICSTKNDTYFFVGNMHRFPTTFMVLGAFYPPKSAP